MKNIIPSIALGLGIASSQVIAQEDTRVLSHNENLGFTPTEIMIHTGKLVHGVTEKSDSKMQEEWKSNLQSIARRVLPGDPVSLRTHTTRGIMYQILGEKNSDIKGYLGVYRDMGSGITHTGLILTIPLGK